MCARVSQVRGTQKSIQEESSDFFKCPYALTLFPNAHIGDIRILPVYAVQRQSRLQLIGLRKRAMTTAGEFVVGFGSAKLGTNPEVVLEQGKKKVAKVEGTVVAFRFRILFFFSEFHIFCLSRFLGWNILATGSGEVSYKCTCKRKARGNIRSQEGRIRRKNVSPRQLGCFGCGKAGASGAERWPRR